MSLLLPTDTCPRCLTFVPVHPHEIDRFEHLGSIAATYACPSCRLRWVTGWSDDALTLPCPGCPQCSPATKPEVA